MSEEFHVALPKLYGAPAYARPPRIVAESPRPVDPDDLPLEAFRSDDHDVVMSGGVAIATNGNGNGHDGAKSSASQLEARPFSLKSLSKFLSGRS